LVGQARRRLQSQVEFIRPEWAALLTEFVPVRVADDFSCQPTVFLKKLVRYVNQFALQITLIVEACRMCACIASMGAFEIFERSYPQ
jgi:hypothetical protein